MPLDLRPLSLGELFDRAFMLYRRHFALFVGITAIPGVFALVMTLAQLWLQRAATSAEGVPIESVALVVWLFAGMIVAMIIYWIVYMIALGATTFAVSEMYVGRPVTIALAYGRMRGRIGALMLLLLLIGVQIFGLTLAAVFVIALSTAVVAAISPWLGGLIAILAGGAIMIAAVVLALRYSLAIPALVLEGLTAGRSLPRSMELTRGRVGRVLLLVICATLVTYATLVICQGPFLAGALIAGMDTSVGFWLNIVGAVAGTVGTTLATPFLIIGLALIYYDARIREEGFDLEVSLAALERV